MSRRMSCSMTLEAITGRGDPTSNRARRRPTPPAPQLTERQRLAATLREQRATITAAWGNTVGATA